MATTAPIGPDSLISVKISVEGGNRRFKIPLRELAPPFLCDKLRQLLEIPAGLPVVFERYSDSAGKYITLDPTNHTAFRSLIRAAKAKHKLRLRTVFPTMSHVSTPVPASNTLYPEKSVFANGPSLLGPSAFPQLTILPPRSFESWANHLEDRKNLEQGKKSTGTASMPPLRSSVAETSLGKDAEDAPADKSYAGINRFNRQADNYIGPDTTLAETRVPIPASWSVFCNACDKPMENEHFHCNTCDEGDYDLCQTCIDKGIHCRHTDHWLIKRFIQDGRVVSSQTNVSSHKQESKPVVNLPKVLSIPHMPGAFADDKKTEIADAQVDAGTRTCNSCIEVVSEDELVTCVDCEDFDLCLQCHEDVAHGHHPGHTFKPISGNAPMSSFATFMCAPGRNTRHAALCDGCDKPIFGVRHKCLTCPDWDYCSECHANVKFIHPGHRFVPIYEPLAEPRHLAVRHFGVYCDGPLCKEKQDNIVGVRYKCAVCHDTDFCANCEASPQNRHNHTHPLIKFKTHFRDVSITTLEDPHNGGESVRLGDQTRQSPPTTPVHSTSSVQTVADLKPTEFVQTSTNKIEIKDLLAEPIEEKIKVDEVFKPVATPYTCKPSELNAQYISDTIVDGTIMAPNQRFIQVWTMKNNGPFPWPAGCSARFVGGDNMLAVDDTHPTSTLTVQAARESHKIDRIVEVGETVSFSIPLKAPNREGVKISHWRLKTAENVTFGHRLWCHIKVVARQPTFSGVEGPAYPLQAAVKCATLSDTCKMMQARARAANAGLEAAKSASVERDLHLTGPASQRVACVELPVERSAVELDLGFQSAEASVGKGKAKLIEIPVTYSGGQRWKSTVLAPSHHDNDEAESNSSSSTMIFPTLEKESPAASIHQDHNGEGQESYAPRSPAKVSAPASPAPTSATLELFDDAESVDVADSSDEEAFLTDEEYDILDASDEEAA